jgi:rod shape-determining protein MreC
MATPPNRRPGFSRKAQYGVLFGYVVAIAGMVVAVLLLVVAIADPQGFAALRGASVDATAPVSSGGRSVTGFFRGIGDGISNYFRAGSQNARLQAELAQARRDLMQAEAEKAENGRLRALLGLARETQDEVAIARLVASSFDSPRRLATLSAGSAAGIRVGMPVRAPDGLIGRVLETGRWASRVLMISDGASSVPVRSLRDGTPAMAVGRGDGTIELRTLEVGENPFRRGDVLVTSGVGGIFPPDVPVARIIRIEGENAIAAPVANPSRADQVIVQPAYQPAATGTLEDAQGQQAAPPVTGPPLAGPTPTPPQLQRNPRYQPALQQPQPGQIVRPPVAAPAPAGQAAPTQAPPQGVRQ